MKKLLKRLMMRGLSILRPQKLEKNFAIRFMAGTLEMEENDFDVAYECIKRNLKEYSYNLLVFFNKVFDFSYGYIRMFSICYSTFQRKVLIN